MSADILTFIIQVSLEAEERQILDVFLKYLFSVRDGGLLGSVWGTTYNSCSVLLPDCYHTAETKVKVTTDIVIAHLGFP